MRFWSGLGWMMREVTGLGGWRRFLRVVWARKKISSKWMERLRGGFRIFLVSAEVVVLEFGPKWSRRRVVSRTLGSWILIGVWALPQLVIVLLSIF
jgi:hypothetical protein